MYSSISRQAEEGTFFNENRPLLGENISATIPLAKDERIWIRWPVTFLRNFIYSPIAFLTAPLRRYDEAHPGQLPALFAVFSLVLFLYLYLKISVKVPRSKEAIDRSSFLVVTLHLSSLPVANGVSAGYL